MEVRFPGLSLLMSHALICSTSSLDLQLHRNIASDPSLGVPELEYAGTNVPRMSNYEAMLISSLLTNVSSHSALQAARAGVKLSKITTREPVPGSRIYERACRNPKHLPNQDARFMDY
jgi:hypothetical protein